MKITKIFTLAAIIVFFASCCACRSSKKHPPVSLTGTEWQLVQMDGMSFAAKDDSFTLNFSEEDKRVTGKGDCNRLMGGYELPSQGKLKIKGLASTRMFCPDQASEDKFVSIINSADAYEIDGNMLMIFSGGEVRMILEKRK